MRRPGYVAPQPLVVAHPVPESVPESAKAHQGQARLGRPEDVTSPRVFYYQSRSNLITRFFPWVVAETAALFLAGLCAAPRVYLDNDHKQRSCQGVELSSLRQARRQVPSIHPAAEKRSQRKLQHRERARGMIPRPSLLYPRY